MSTKTQVNQANNAVVERALLIGRQIQEQDDKIVVKLTESQEQKLNQLIEVTGLSLETILNLAIKYALYYTKIQQVDLAEVKDYPKKLGANLIEVSITGKTTARLQEANLYEQVDECAVVGIKLLHRKLVPVQSIKIKRAKNTN